MKLNIQILKQSLRERIQEEVRGIPAGERAAFSGQACRRLQEQPEWKSARSIMLFSPMPDELDIRPLIHHGIEAGKVVTLPRFDREHECYEPAQLFDPERDLVLGQFGINEPAPYCAVYPLKRLDFVLVPGVAFDVRGYRLGRGKGYYDRLLTDITGIRCGVAFDQQITDRIPIEHHDLDVGCILTPTRWLRCDGQSAGWQ